MFGWRFCNRGSRVEHLAMELLTDWLAPVRFVSSQFTTARVGADVATKLVSPFFRLEMIDDVCYCIQDNLKALEADEWTSSKWRSLLKRERLSRNYQHSSVKGFAW